MAQTHGRGSRGTPLAIHLLYHAVKSLELFEERRIFPLLAPLLYGGPAQDSPHLIPGTEPVPRRLGAQYPDPDQLAYVFVEVAHLERGVVQGSCAHHLLAGEGVIQEVPGGLPPPTQEERTHEAIRQTVEQVELEGVACAFILLAEASDLLGEAAFGLGEALFGEARLASCYLGLLGEAPFRDPRPASGDQGGPDGAYPCGDAA